MASVHLTYLLSGHDPTVLQLGCLPWPSSTHPSPWARSNPCFCLSSIHVNKPFGESTFYALNSIQQIFPQYLLRTMCQADGGGGVQGRHKHELNLGSALKEPRGTPKRCPFPDLQPPAIWPTQFSKMSHACPRFSSVSGKILFFDQTHCSGAVVMEEQRPGQPDKP